MKYIFIILKFLKWIAPALGVLAAGLCCIAVLIFLYKALKALNISKRIQKQRKKNAECKENKHAKQGLWELPCELFFRKCAEHNISKFDSDYSIQKAANIITELAAKKGIRQENLEKYLIPAKFQKYYQQGKEIAGAKDSAEAVRKKQPHKAVPIYSESVFLRRAASLAKLHGADKRRKMLSYLLGDYQDKIAFKEEYDVAPGVFETAMILQPQHSSCSASGNNAAIIHNTAYLLSGIPDLPYGMQQLKECTENVKERLSDSSQKVVLSYPTAADILRNLHICETEVRKSDSGVLHITLSIALKTPFTLDIPQSIQMVVDGVLRGTVMFENTPIGDILFPLPLYGIPSNTTNVIKLTGLCPFSVESDRYIESWSRLNPFGDDPITEILRDFLDEDTQSVGSGCCEYSVKLEQVQNLWIMEA